MDPTFPIAQLALWSQRHLFYGLLLRLGPLHFYTLYQLDFLRNHGESEGLERELLESLAKAEAKMIQH